MLLGAAPSTGFVMLKRGASGPAVTAVQQRLQAAGFSPGAIDGKFGPGTESAVKMFQRARGLTVDGIVGPKTAAALGVALPASSGSGALVPVSASDVAVGVDGGGVPWGLVAAGVGGLAALALLMKKRPQRRNPARRRRRRRGRRRAR